MTRKVTAEERRIIIDNPELVMFDPYPAIKYHPPVSLGKALIIPSVVIVILVALCFLFPNVLEDHPTLSGAGIFILIVVSCAFLPLLNLFINERNLKKARACHYSEQLKARLPEELECKVVQVDYVVYEKGEGGWIDDGKKEMFSYSGFVNYFRIVPQTDLAIVFSVEGKFFAYIKRDTRTESFYR